MLALRPALNIIPLALSHGLGTLALRYAFDEAIIGRLRIGEANVASDHAGTFRNVAVMNGGPFAFSY